MTIDSCTLESHPLESRLSASTPISGRPLDDRSPQAAIILGVCTETVSHMVERGELRRPVRFNHRTLRWLRSDVEALAARTRKVKAEAGSLAVEKAAQGDSEGMRRALATVPEHRQGQAMRDG